MTEGTDSWRGLAQPLFGDYETKQRTAATDHWTATAASGATGDFLVFQTAGGGEVFVVGAAGELTVTGALTITEDVIISGANYIRPQIATTAPTTALTKGDIFIGVGHTRPQLGVCISTAANTLWYLTADTSVFGSTTRNSA